MLHDRDEALREALKRSDESKEKLFESWMVDLVDPEDEECCGEQDDCSTCEN